MYYSVCLKFLAFLLSASACLADWEIVNVETNSLPVDSPPSKTVDVMVDIDIVNTAESTRYIYGQKYSPSTFYYHIESFVKGADSDVWEKRSSQMCGSLGTIGMVPVAAGDTLRSRHRFGEAEVGGMVVLTFRSASSELDSRGSEVLLGPFEIPVAPFSGQE